MNLIINHSSMEPIYEQLSRQLRALISTGQMKEGEPLPSVRALAKELRISALTVKKAYDDLEQAGFVRTVHGKGSFVSSACQELFLEQQKQKVENLLEQAARKGRSLGLSNQELADTFELILEDLS